MHLTTSSDDGRSDILPRDTLCISSGRAAWCLYIDATCLNYDGNAFDAALVAIMAALGNSAYSLLPNTIAPDDDSSDTTPGDVRSRYVHNHV